MSKVKLKNIPKLTLNDLLRRRKMTLESFVKELGTQSYNALVARSDRLGVQPPTEKEYLKIFPNIVNSQQDGVIVLEPIVVIDDKTGREIDPDAPVQKPGVFVVTEQPELLEHEDTEKKFKRKKKKTKQMVLDGHKLDQNSSQNPEPLDPVD